MGTGKRKERPSTSVSVKRESIAVPLIDQSDVDVPMKDDDVDHDPWRALYMYISEVIALHTRLSARHSEDDYHEAMESARQLFTSINHLPTDEQIDSANNSSSVQANLNMLIEKLIGKQPNNQNQPTMYTHQRTSLSFMTAQLITKWSSYQIPVADDDFAKAVIEQTKQAFAPQLKQMKEAGLQTPAAIASFESALRTVFCNSLGQSSLDKKLFVSAIK